MPNERLVDAIKSLDYVFNYNLIRLKESVDKREHTLSFHYIDRVMKILDLQERLLKLGFSGGEDASTS